MKFLIDRSSNLSPMSKKAPCEGAVREAGAWTIEIATLDDLLAISKRSKHNLIIDASGSGLPSIEIYDCYRE